MELLLPSLIYKPHRICLYSFSLNSFLILSALMYQLLLILSSSILIKINATQKLCPMLIRGCYSYRNPNYIIKEHENLLILGTHKLRRYW